ncbi:deaminase [Microbacterium caowuchunii]|uniref:dihydrofolate reductase family protein n=1 Tax=Microbacterium caowuchunii TaxID=2614638 RepID=UPI001247C70F|nr:dihydrofolate reductase family protein [Microbacterium caowuchunii]QEV99427.1 deaminase [Microbacterium caowuchunii]
MTGRFVYWMNVSADLRIEQAAGENGGGSWMRIGESLHREFNARAARLAVMVQGRTMYEIMEAFWPAARQNEAYPDYIREYGEIWTSAPKVLVSRHRTDADFNTRVLTADDAIPELTALREETDGDIGVGGATIATHLLQAGLLDELMLFVHPVILGEGRPLFDGDPGPIELDVIETAQFEAGVVLHRYAVRPGGVRARR